MVHSDNPFVNLLFHLLDAVILLVSLLFCVWFMNVKWVPDYSLAVLVAIILFFVVGGTSQLYDRTWRSVSLTTEAAKVIHVWFWVALGLLAMAYATKTTAVFSRRTMTMWFFVGPAVLVGWRVLVRILLRHVRQMERNARHIVIAGAGELGLQLAEAIRLHPGMGLRVDAFYDDGLTVGQTPPGAESEVRVAGSLEQLVADARQGRFHEVYITLPIHAEERIRQLLAGLADTSLQTYIVPDLFAFTLLHAQMGDIAGMPVVSVYGSPHSGMGGIAKRLEDIIGSLLILLIISVPMLLIALAIRLTSSGPVLFKQRRYGLSGEEVYVWKFRTMRVMQDNDNVRQATRDDPRVTPLGRFLRRTSLDELPQFFNVLQGHMSIVGPRPHAVVHNEQYRQLIPGYMLRHIVKPGITGWAQINGWRGETETLDKMQKRIEFDLEYIRNWSIWLDLKIIFLTVVRGIVSRQAY